MPKKQCQESQAAFSWDCLGVSGERVLGNHKWFEADKENVGTLFDKLEQKCHPSGNQTLYNNQFFMIRKRSSVTFSVLYHEKFHIYDLCKFEEDRGCETHKTYQDCKQATRQIQIRHPDLSCMV